MLTVKSNENDDIQVYNVLGSGANCGSLKKSSRGGGYRGEERLLHLLTPLRLHGGNGCQMLPHLGCNTRSEWNSVIRISWSTTAFFFIFLGPVL